MLNPGEITFSVLKEDRDGSPTESWLCIDCGFNTAPGFFNQVELDKAFAADSGVNKSEVYIVRDAVWKRAGMEPFGGCLCIGCLEGRLGRRLKPKDFLRDHEFNHPRMPGTPRLLKRRGQRKRETR